MEYRSGLGDSGLVLAPRGRRGSDGGSTRRKSHATPAGKCLWLVFGPVNVLRVLFRLLVLKEHYKDNRVLLFLFVSFFFGGGFSQKRHALRDGWQMGRG